MKQMIRAGHKEAKFFTGVEVEHTPALGKQTLFVVGVKTFAFEFDEPSSRKEFVCWV